ncbi:hypothetical protein A7X12_07080 [Sphingomonas sp. TDK1]|nr:hypothetical protein A7X12_07080 [Sphingomonas sp. TDK1]
MRLVGAAVLFSTLSVPIRASAAPLQEEADVFIGTLERDGNALILRRCDLVENRYTLVDAPGAHVVDKLRKAKLPAYGEVIARYVEGEDGGSILRVERVETLTPGKSCHLADALTG